MTRLGRALLALALVTGVSGAPVACSGGVVGGDCYQGFGLCGGRCLDFRTDTNNCGACGHTCADSEVCTDGACLLAVDGSAGSSGSSSVGGAGGATGSSGGAGGTAGHGGSAADAGVAGAGVAGAGGVVAAGDASTGGTSGGGTSGTSGGGGTSAGGSSSGGSSSGGSSSGGSSSGGAGGSNGGTSGGGGVAGVDAGPQCTGPLDTAAQCGSCNVQCTAPTPICTPGNDGHICTDKCVAPLVLCGKQCVNTDTDESNCGKCNKKCASGICQGGVCVGATAGHEVSLCMDYRTQPALGSPQQRLLGNAVYLPTTEPVRVLGFEESTPASVVTAVNATLKAAAAARGRTYSAPTPALTSLDVLNRLSTAKFDVLLVYDQPNAPAGHLATLGGDWASTMDSFVRAGGTVVVLAGVRGQGEMPDFLSGAGFLTVTGQASVNGSQIYNRALGDAIGLNVLTSFRAGVETCTFAGPVVDATSSFVITDTPATDGTIGSPVVVHRVLSP